MKRIFCLSLLLLTLGCSKAIFRPYVGAQQAWPTAEGSIVNVKHQLPIFTTLPPVPYDVIGELRIDSPFFEQPGPGHLPLLVKKAQDLGADALVFVQGKIFFATNYGPRREAATPAGENVATLTQVNTFNPESFQREVNILAVKWTKGPPPGMEWAYQEGKKGAPEAETPAASTNAPAATPTPAPAPAVPAPAPAAAPAAPAK